MARVEDQLAEGGFTEETWTYLGTELVSDGKAQYAWQDETGARHVWNKPLAANLIASSCYRVYVKRNGDSLTARKWARFVRRSVADNADVIAATSRANDLALRTYRLGKAAKNESLAEMTLSQLRRKLYAAPAPIRQAWLVLILKELSV